jgi:hypothetical protein
MTKQTRARPEVALVEWFAGHISSPVARLRFLQSALHAEEPASPRLRLQKLAVWLGVPLLLALIVLTPPTTKKRLRIADPDVDAPIVAPPAAVAVRVAPVPEVWQIEKTKTYETWSNGLRIDDRFAVSTHRRTYLVFSAVQPDDARGERRTAPAGIVYHTTESLQVPFVAAENRTLERIGESLLDFVKYKRAYNFVIDRFGRVYRVVEEGDAANHAGYSVWADPQWAYLNLNESFLAVAFETQTLPGQAEATVSPAQIRSAAMLTELLRKRYGIAAGNCVTHGQVSVNAASLRVGFHHDWASSFPFAQLGLPDNYEVPLPAVSFFGFEYDSDFERKSGAHLYRQAQLGELELRERAAAARLPVAVYRSALQKRYRGWLAMVRHNAGRPEEDE